MQICVSQHDDVEPITGVAHLRVLISAARTLADIRVIATGSGFTVVRAELEVDSGGIGATQLDLSPGDSITVNVSVGACYRRWLA